MTRDDDLVLLLHQLTAISQEKAPDDRTKWEWHREQGWDAIGRVVRYLDAKGLRMNMELVSLTRIHQALRDLDRGVVPGVLRPAERETSARPRAQRFDHMVGAILVAVQMLYDSGIELREAYEIVAVDFRKTGHLSWQRKPITRRNVRDWWAARDSKWAVTSWRNAYQQQRQAFAAVEPYPLSRKQVDWAVRKLSVHPVLQKDGYLAS